MVPVAEWRPSAAVDADVAAARAEVPVLQRTWWLTVRPTVRLLPVTDVHRDRIAWLVGGTITLLFTLLTASTATARDRALRKVDAATAALREDIAQREVTEQQLRRRENELKGFAGVVAHDLRNPLARISGYTDFLREEAWPTLTPEHRDFLDRVRVGAQQMQALIDDLLDYATADNRDIQQVEVDLNRIVAGIVHDRSAPVETGDLPSVLGDPILLRQVFDNLIGNAVKYARPGLPPRVEITAHEEPDGSQTIEVSDNGIGVPAAARESIFTPFVRAEGAERYPGTGLGLAIVHRIVERHDGRITVDDNPAGGSRFRLTLPA